MSPRDSYRAPAGAGGGIGLGGPIPRDVGILLGVLLATYSLQFFSSTSLIPALLRLGRLVWLRGFAWQLVTYPFIGAGGASLWFLLTLLILLWFGRDVFAGLGRRHFWQLILAGAVIGGLIAVLVDVVQWALDDTARAEPTYVYPIMQGQQLLIAIFVCAFATANRNAQILLFFVLPVEARWFIAIEVLIAFISFLQTHDLPGFAGLCTAIGVTYIYVRDGGIGRGLRQTRLRAQRWWLQRRLNATRRKRGFRVISGDQRKDDRWLH